MESRTSTAIMTAAVRLIFRKRSDWAEPGTEGLFEHYAHQQKCHEEEQGSGMDGGNAAGGDEVLEVHQPGDWKPAFNSWRARDLEIGRALEGADPEKELDAQPEIEHGEQDLDDFASELGAVRRRSADNFLFCGRDELRGTCHGGFRTDSRVGNTDEFGCDLAHMSGNTSGSFEDAVLRTRGQEFQTIRPTRGGWRRRWLAHGAALRIRIQLRS